MVKNLPASPGDTGLIPGLGRSPRERNGKSLQYSCLENPMHRGAWRGTVYMVAKSDMTYQANNVGLAFSFHLLLMGLFQPSRCPTLPVIMLRRQVLLLGTQPPASLQLYSTNVERDVNSGLEIKFYKNSMPHAAGAAVMLFSSTKGSKNQPGRAKSTQWELREMWGPSQRSHHLFSISTELMNTWS